MAEQWLCIILRVHIIVIRIRGRENPCATAFKPKQVRKRTTCYIIIIIRTDRVKKLSPQSCRCRAI